MSTKPSKLPEWASDPGADISEPSEAKKDQGWTNAEKPPAGYFNWWKNLAFQWFNFTKTYAETHTHSGGAGDHEAPKVDLGNHIDYGDEGGVSVTTDTALEHRVSHTATGSSVFDSDNLVANETIHIDGDTDGVKLEQVSGLSGARQLQVSASNGTDITGMRSEAYLVTRSHSPAGNFGALFPEDQSQYIKNLTKSVLIVDLTETSEVTQLTTADSYNAGSLVTHGGTAWKFSIPEDTNIIGSVTSSVGVKDADTTSDQFKVEAHWEPSETAVIVRVYVFDASTSLWDNLRIAAPTGMNIRISVEVK